MRFIIIILSICVVHGQNRIGDWESYTSTLNVNQILELNGTIIGATDGGLLIYDKNTKLFDELNNIDELTNSKISCIALGDSKQIWIGGGEPNGFVQIYDIEQRKNVKEFEYDVTEIIDFAVSDSLIYAIYRDQNDYGIIEIIYLHGEYIHKDLYPNWPQNSQLYEIEIYEGKVFVGTEIGLYFGKKGEDPNNWITPFTELNNPVKSIFLEENNLDCFSNEKLYTIDINNLQLLSINDLNGIILEDFVRIQNQDIIGFNDKNIYIISGAIAEQISVVKNSLNSVNYFNDGSVVFGTNTGFGVLNENSSIDHIIPNTLVTNFFQAITFLNDGRVVGGSAQGLAIKESNGWRNIVESAKNISIQHDKNYDFFIADSIPVDFGSSISKMIQGLDGLLYCAIEGTYPSRNGGGIIILDIDNPANFTLIDTTYLDYFSDEFLVVKDITFDRSGNLWVADPFATTKHEPIHVRTAANDWISFNADEAFGSIGLTPSTIATDAWNRVWVGSFQGSGVNSGFPDGGLSMLAYSGEASSPSEIIWKSIPLSSSSNTVWSLAVTPENRLYMLTPVGLTFYDLQFSNDEPIKFESPRYYFPNIAFGQESEIRLDARGNAWTVSGSDGIHVLLSNSTFWPDEIENSSVESINTDNYPLLSNNVTDITFDDNNGVAYISTNRGINSFRIPFATPKSKYSDLKIYPSPFHIPSDKPLIIDNLKDNSSLKVMTVTGQVIRSLESNNLGENGYQIKWDGKNNEGSWVNSGVYILAVYTADGSHKLEKTVVIRN